MGSHLRGCLQLPDAHRTTLPATTLAVIGGPGDRRRWFVEAARAYAEALGTPPPPVTDMDTRRVGAEGDPMILTQARAVLAAQAGTPERADAIRTASIDNVAVALVEHERQRWHRAAAITPGLFTAPEVDRLLDLLAPTMFIALRAALQELAVQHVRDILDKQNTDEARAALAHSLSSLGVSLWALGRSEAALEADKEAVRRRRELVAQNPARFTPDLATSLTNQALVLCDLGRHDEELELRAERVMRWRILARRDPDRHKHTYECRCVV